MPKVNKPNLTEVRLIAMAATYKGNKTAVARALHVTRQAIQGWAKEHEAVQQAFDDAKEGLLDRIESKAYAAAERGEVWAVCLVLKTQGQSRGWIEKRAIAGDDGQPVEIHVTYGDKKKPG